MIGAICGDMIGAPYEFDCNNIKTTRFPLWQPASRFTDDSVLTLAVAEALMDSVQGGLPFEKQVFQSMRSYAERYPDAGYGLRFWGWLHSGDPQPYNSWGNGSAMRVSSIGWAFSTLEETLRWAKASAEVTHNHPEGIKGAQATAAAIFLARTGASIEEIRSYVAQSFGYDFSRTLNEIRPYYHHVESCQETVPEALTAFFESTGFEDAIRKVVSIGGDSDTAACICGSVAEAYWGVPQDIDSEARRRLDPFLRNSLQRFEAWLAARA